MEAKFIYRNRSDVGFFDASTRKMRGGPDKVIVYIDGLLCAMDREAKIVIPVSRWKLVEIGLACFLAALKGKGASHSLESMAVPEPPPALPDPPRSVCCAATTTKGHPWKLHIRRLPKPNGSVLYGKCAIYLDRMPDDNASPTRTKRWTNGSRASAERFGNPPTAAIGPYK